MTNGNDQAFASWANYEVGHYGLTKREYFAAMAMQGLAGNNDLVSAIAASYPELRQARIGKVLAIQAVHYADDLIEALNAEQSK